MRSELAVPLIVKNRLIGVIDIQSEQPDYFKPEHLQLLTLTASRIAQSIENARLYTRVARQAQTLAVMNEISRELTSILDLDTLLERIGQLVRRLIDYHMFTIWLLNEKDQVLEGQYGVRFGERYIPEEKVPLDRGLVNAAITERRAVLVGDVRKDPRYHMVNPETRSEMAVPLIYKGKVIGVLDIEHTRAYYFNEDHERAITTLAAQIAISIENARLYQRIAQQEQRLEHDLAMAREVQLRLLPQTKPKHLHAEFAAKFLAARTIGGDVYDFLTFDPCCTGIVLGDVSGKAAAAALFAAVVSGVIRSLANASLSPSAMLEAAQRIAAGAAARLAIRGHGLRGLERQQPDAAARQCGRDPAHLLSWRRSGDRAGRRLSPGHVSRGQVRGVQPRDPARRLDHLLQRRHPRCTKRRRRDVRRRIVDECRPRQPAQVGLGDRRRRFSTKSRNFRAMLTALMTRPSSCSR